MIGYSYTVIKIHEVGHYFDVWIINASLTDNLLEHIADASRKYEHRDIVLLELIKEFLIAFSVRQKYDMISQL